MKRNDNDWKAGSNKRRNFGQLPPVVKTLIHISINQEDSPGMSSILSFISPLFHMLKELQKRLTSRHHPASTTSSTGQYIDKAYYGQLIKAHRKNAQGDDFIIFESRRANDILP